MKLKIGDKVLLKESSQYVDGCSFDGDSSNPLNIFGIIDEVTGWYSVKWENGKHNGAYTDDDLELFESLEISNTLEEENKALKALVETLREENLGLKAELALFLIEIEQEKEEKPKKRRILFV